MIIFIRRKTLDRFWMLDTGYWMQDAGSMLNTETECWILDMFPAGGRQRMNPEKYLIATNTWISDGHGELDAGLIQYRVIQHPVVYLFL